jgi:hypothetical protein
MGVRGNRLSPKAANIGEEKKFNERLNLSANKDQFVEIMRDRKIPWPAKMDMLFPPI